MATHSITLPATCPENPAEDQQCGTCLRERLHGMPGISGMTFSPQNGTSLAEVNFAYDPEIIPLTKLRAELNRAGACLVEQTARPTKHHAAWRALNVVLHHGTLLTAVAGALLLLTAVIARGLHAPLW